MIRWKMWFALYQFEVEHLAGEKNSLADFMTREFHKGKDTCLTFSLIKERQVAGYTIKGKPGAPIVLLPLTFL